MDHFEEIYARKAAAYHQLIAAEDVEENLLPALEAVTAFAEKRVLDLGTGTGRIPLLVNGIVKSIVGLDLNYPMLAEQAEQRDALGGSWPLVTGDMRWLPLKGNCFDVVIAGWAIGHLRGWYEGTWKEQMSLIFSEMMRLVAPGGVLIVLETMTTGATKPAPPTEGLAEYYQWMEAEWGFSRQVIQTDYQFESLEDAVSCTEFFFGAELSQAIRENGWVRLPEWTGVWGKKV